MPRVFTISTQGDAIFTINALKRMRHKFPKMTRDAMREWGKKLEKDMKSSVRLAEITPFKGGLQGRGIRYDQGKRSDVGHLFIRVYGIKLDGMKSHHVNVKRRRTVLLAWAKQARNARIRKRARLVEQKKIKPFSIYVKKHPFIRNGYKRARPKLRPILRKLIKRGILNV